MTANRLYRLGQALPTHTSLACTMKPLTSRELKDLLSSTVETFESSYPSTPLPPMIDLVCWHASIPTYIIREARQILTQRRNATHD